MSVIIRYNNETLCTAEAGQTVTLNTASRMLVSNLEILVDTDFITFTVNNVTYTAQPDEPWYDWITRLGDADTEIYETPNGTFSCAGENSPVYFNDLVLNCQETAGIIDEGSDLIRNGYHYYTESQTEEPEEPSTDDISFWVDGTAYTAAQGTYWSEFIAQNSSTFSTDAGVVLYQSNPVYCSSNRARVTPEDPIHFEEYYAHRFVFTINGIAFTFNEDGRPLYAVTGPVADRLEFGENTVTFDGNTVKNADNTADISPNAFPSDGTAYIAGAAAATGNLSFSVNGVNYSGLYGMPWYDWCHSTYNTTASDVGSRAFCYNKNSEVIFGIQDGPENQVLCASGTRNSVNSGSIVEASTEYDAITI